MPDPLPFRPLLSRERALLDFLLAEEFPGVRELRIQARNVNARLWNGIPTLVDLQVSDPQAPRATVHDRVPIEAEVSDPNASQELLLHVVDGLLNSLELVSYDDDDPAELPSPSAFEQPWVKPAPTQASKRRRR